MAVKGPPPKATRPTPTFSTFKAKTSGSEQKKGQKAQSPRSSGGKEARRSQAAGPVEAPSTHGVDPEEEAQERVAYNKRREADLEEEGRRHATVDADVDAKREEDLELQRRMERASQEEERKRRQRRYQQEDDETEDGEEAAEKAQAAQEAGYTEGSSVGKYFQDMPEDRMGDLSLRNPLEMKRALGPSVRFAQHAMLLAQHEVDRGVARDDAVKFLAELYLGLGDRGYANKALKEFGPATGILDIYPLEVMDHLLEHVPGFFTKVSRGRFLTSSRTEGYRAKAGEPIRLEYEPSLRIRGFAVEGGARPGYLLEPIEPPGTYQLVFLTPGDFSILISAISKDGRLLIEKLRCAIEPSDEATEPLLAHEREREHEREEEADGTDDDEPKRKKKDDDLRIHFPKRI